MIRKVKVIFVLFVLIGIILSPLKKVNAHSIELDPESLITMPNIIIGGSGKITIKNSVTSYTLYYQPVQISSVVYSQIQKTKLNGEKDLNDLKEEYTELKTEADNLKTTFDEASTAYQTGITNNVSQTELETLKTAYETARKNYQAKTKEYNNKVTEYKNKVNEINNKIKELTPTYAENNWTQTKDNKISVDSTKFSGEQAYAIWVKLVTSNNTYYDEGIYTIMGTKAADVSVKSVTLDKTSLSINEGSSYTLTATINPTDATNKSLKWKSDNEKVATVSNGKITGISEGNATITVTTDDGDYTATCKVTVTKTTNASDSHKDTTNDSKSVKSVALNKTSLSINKGSSYTLTATINPTDATNKSLKWKSDNEKVATVSKGKVKGISEGNATITVTTDDGQYTATCKVTVNKKTTQTTVKDKDDTTVSSGKLPQTGVNMIIAIIGIIAITLISILMYKKYNNYKDIN